MPNYKLPALGDVSVTNVYNAACDLCGCARWRQLIASIDSARLAEHGRNRGLRGLERRLAEGIAQARACGLPAQASVTVSRLVRYDELREVSSLFPAQRGAIVLGDGRGDSEDAPLGPPEKRAAARMQLSRMADCRMQRVKEA